MGGKIGSFPRQADFWVLCVPGNYSLLRQQGSCSQEHGELIKHNTDLLRQQMQDKKAEDSFWHSSRLLRSFRNSWRSVTGNPFCWYFFKKYTVLLPYLQSMKNCSLCQQTKPTFAKIKLSHIASSDPRNDINNAESMSVPEGQARATMEQRTIQRKTPLVPGWSRGGLYKIKAMIQRLKF